MLGLMLLSGFCRNDHLPLGARVSVTCSQTLTMHHNPRCCWVFYFCSSAIARLTWLRRFRKVRLSLGVQETVTNKYPDGGVSRPCFLPRR